MSQICCAELASLLAIQQTRIVLAESCTAGLVAASLAQVPGISAYLCGSAVTYRDATKEQWLGVSAQLLRELGAVSEAVAAAMARGVLERTPEARWSASVTGHLGPQSPPGLDGVVFIAVARRRPASDCEVVSMRRLQLSARGREERQREAAQCVIRQLHDAISAASIPSASRVVPPPDQPGQGESA